MCFKLLALQARSGRGRARARTALVSVAAAVAIAACSSAGSATSRSSSSASPSIARASAQISDSAISVSTKMICASEAQEDLSATLGSKTVSPVTPTWKDDVYACTYQYVNGGFKLSVKQLPDEASTKRYFTRLGTQLGREKTLTGLGQGAFTTKNGSVVVDKDDKVLLVDVQRLPAQFGVPADTRANVAISVAATIMGCWTGA